MSDIHPVSITDLPAEEVKDQAVEDKATDAPSSEKACDNGSRTRILVSIRMNNVPYFLISDKKL